MLCLLDKKLSGLECSGQQRLDMTDRAIREAFCLLFGILFPFLFSPSAQSMPISSCVFPLFSVLFSAFHI